MFQNLLFRIVKEPLLHGKSGSFGVQNLRFCNAKTKLSFFFRIIFTKLRLFFCISLEQRKRNKPCRTNSQQDFVCSKKTKGIKINAETLNELQHLFCLTLIVFCLMNRGSLTVSLFSLLHNLLNFYL